MLESKTQLGSPVFRICFLFKISSLMKYPSLYLKNSISLATVSVFCLLIKSHPKPGFDCLGSHVLTKQHRNWLLQIICITFVQLFKTTNFDNLYVTWLTTWRFDSGSPYLFRTKRFFSLGISKRMRWSKKGWGKLGGNLNWAFTVDSMVTCQKKYKKVSLLLLTQISFWFPE